MDLSILLMQENDLEFLNRVRNEYASQFLHDSRTFTLDETKQWFNNTNPTYYIIKDNNLDANIGYFRISNYSEVNKNLYIGADIAPECKGMGYAKPAYKQFMKYLFEYLNLNKISLEVLDTNHIAINLYSSLGFVYEGAKRQEVLKNGVWVNSIIMSILKDEFYENRN
jgi:RimJ/RimL family protein N-acetyltransferase